MIEEPSPLVAPKNSSPNKKDYWHAQHCFGYLSQSTMCSGGIVLKGAETTFPPGIKVRDGWDAKHICRLYAGVLLP